MLILELRSLVGREPENSINVRIKARGVLQCQEVVVVEAGVLFQLKSYLAVHLAGGCEADEVVPEFATERCAAIGDLRWLVTYHRLREAIAHVVSLGLTAVGRAKVRSDC